MPPEPLPVAPVSRTSLSTLVAGQLRERIVTGSLAIGTQLPTEKALTEQFGVSRSTVREALRILQAQGLLSGGDRVSTTRPLVSNERTLHAAATALENVMLLGGVPLPDLVELRVVLESAALERAAEEAQETDLTAVREALATMHLARDEADVKAFHTADVTFHVALVGAGGNRAYALVLGVLREVIAGHLREALTAVADKDRVLADLFAQHERILAAVDEGDGPAARRHIAAHILDFYSAHGREVGA